MFSLRRPLLRRPLFVSVRILIISSSYRDSNPVMFLLFDIYYFSVNTPRDCRVVLMLRRNTSDVRGVWGLRGARDERCEGWEVWGVRGVRVERCEEWEWKSLETRVLRLNLVVWFLLCIIHRKEWVEVTWNNEIISKLT